MYGQCARKWYIYTFWRFFSYFLWNGGNIDALFFLFSYMMSSCPFPDDMLFLPAIQILTLALLSLPLCSNTCWINHVGWASHPRVTGQVVQFHQRTVRSIGHWLRSALLVHAFSQNNRNLTWRPHIWSITLKSISDFTILIWFVFFCPYTQLIIIPCM